VTLLGFSEAIPAVNGLVAAGLERHFRRLAALRASYRIHLAGSPASIAATFIAKTLGSASGSAGGATLGLIGKAFGGEEFLLFSREGEGFAAIGTLKGLFCVSH
jgi:hypothetical protein